MIEQLQTLYGFGSRVVASLAFRRFEDDVTSTGLLDGSNSYRGQLNGGN